jgi:hypothetical protein
MHGHTHHGSTPLSARIPHMHLFGSDDSLEILFSAPSGILSRASTGVLLKQVPSHLINMIGPREKRY